MGERERVLGRSRGGALSNCGHTQTDKGIQRALSAVGRRHDVLVGKVVMVGYAMPRITTEGSKRGGPNRDTRDPTFQLMGLLAGTQRSFQCCFDFF